MRLAYLVPEFPGQTHDFFMREVLALEALGAEVLLFSTRQPPARIISHPWSAAAMARTRYLLPPPGRAFAAALPWLPVAGALAALKAEGAAATRDLLTALPVAADFRRQAAALGIDHVHAHSCGRTALIAAEARRMGGPPYSLTLHGPLSDYGPLQRRKWRGAAFATVITRKLLAEVQAALAGDLPPRVEVQPMGVDVEFFRRDQPYRPAEPGGPVRVFCCGRLNAVKGHEVLIRAVGQLAAAGLDVRLEIAGEDEAGGTGYRRVLEAQIAAAGLGERVTLLGAIGREAVRDRLIASHLFALASRAEPLGVVYMEAMSCQVPVIATDAGGVPEMITDGETGLLVPPGDPDALAAAIRRLAADPDLALRLGLAGRQLAEARYQAKRGAETLLRLATETRR